MKIASGTEDGFSLIPRPGQTVRVLGGPWRDFSGTIQTVDWGSRKASVAMSIFGHDTTADFDLVDIKRI